MDEKKMNEVIKALFEGLTDEQKKAVKACENSDELMKLLGEWGVELPDDEVDQVAGGGFYDWIWGDEHGPNPWKDFIESIF